MPMRGPPDTFRLNGPTRALFASTHPEVQMSVIRVKAPDSISASELTWHLSEHSTVAEISGSYWVLIDASHGSMAVFVAIRGWLGLQGLESIDAYVGDVRHTIHAPIVEPEEWGDAEDGA
jgi:hypothetical protein